ncbi:hypothetical protein NX784_15090 [Massilia pinisoli]|uniref:Uncharacterized protein n=1 Tax=Massilia pinisoli TaxID=1772194 RepID=A0ABT1ZSJ9_9BURK|nr:hypothetical protein [Massilia pinisoli]MCS0582915.1 hypothetical protein [Massilia pinisoli]
MAPRVGASRATGLLCVAVLHVGAWYLAGHSAPARNQAGPAATTSANVITLRIVHTPAPRTSAGESITVTPAVKPKRRNEWHLAVPQPDAASLETAPTASPANSDETGVSASGALLPDSATVKHVIADFVAEDRAQPGHAEPALTSRRSPAEKAIGAAFRPRCNSDDAARLGNIRLTGILRLAALVHGAVSDTGCKW